MHAKKTWKVYHLNSLRIFLLVVAALGLALGLAAAFAGQDNWRPWIWGGSGGLVLAVLLMDIVTSLVKGDAGLDFVAGLSMSAALLFGETLAC